MVALKYDTLTENALEVQRIATDPDSHVWVSASAGTGKTKVLTDRILNLLLKGINPRKILCLTFTNAAASEMMQRLLDRLGQWASCSEFELRRELHLLMGHTPPQESQNRARALFVDILETPGGFRIQTIHSFCQSLLSSFPLEAGLALETAIMTDRQQEEILAQAQETVLKSAQQDPLLEQAITLLAEQFHSETFKQLCKTFLQERLKLGLVLSSGMESARAAILKALELGEAENALSPRTLFNEIWGEEKETSISLKKIALALLKGRATDKKRGEAILIWLDQPKTLESFSAYADHFLTEKGEIRQKLVTREILDSFPHGEDLLLKEATRIQETFDFLKKLKIAEISLALLTVSTTLLRHYEALKAEQHILDYDDLILKASALLHHSEFAPWILYKLDGGIDHLLVDEAQDTNTLQWSIIKALTEEFFAGKDAQNQSRTLFVVGDPKQSIYSFQGTDPKIFTAMRAHFSRRLSNDEKSWKDLEMSLSFRSTSVILDFVDALFAEENARAGVHNEENTLKHLCFRAGQAGHIELWPLVTTNPESGTSPSARTMLAYGVADQIEKWLRQGAFLVSRGRVMKAGDIMVLVRTRTEFVPALIQSLKSRGIPVGGLDRLNLLEELAIQDLMALSEFLLLPENDFALACVLKSPFGGLNEEELFHLATTRGQKTLWENLKEHSSDFEGLVDRLTDLLRQVDFVSPFTLYSEILFTHKGLQKIMARFGHDVMDPLEEFLGLAYEYHGQSSSSLQGFLHWLQQGRLEIKRDFSQTESGEVRIMTIHGAKGLQAPVVILADTVSRPTLKQHFLWHDDHSPACLWSPPQNLDTKMTQQLKRQIKTLQDQEYRRLLYVALTRAEDQLYICGAHENQRDIKGSWYHLVESILSSHAKKISLPWGEGYRLENPQEIPPPLPPRNPETSPQKAEMDPPWLFEATEEEQDLFSKTAVTQEIQALQDSPLSPSLLKGCLIHDLLEILPLLPPEAQCQRILACKQEWQDAREIFEDAVITVQNILTDKAFDCLFQGNSKSEVPLMGYYQGKLYTARLDRLVVFDNELWIIDYKTDAHPPAHPHQMDQRYKNQLRLYRELVQQLYPRHHLKTMILWTETRHLMEV